MDDRAAVARRARRLRRVHLRRGGPPASGAGRPGPAGRPPHHAGADHRDRGERAAGLAAELPGGVHARHGRHLGGPEPARHDPARAAVRHARQPGPGPGGRDHRPAAGSARQRHRHRGRSPAADRRRPGARPARAGARGAEAAVGERAGGNRRPEPGAGPAAPQPVRGPGRHVTVPARQLYRQRMAQPQRGAHRRDHPGRAGADRAAAEPAAGRDRADRHGNVAAGRHRGPVLARIHVQRAGHARPAAGPRGRGRRECGYGAPPDDPPAVRTSGRQPANRRRAGPRGLRRAAWPAVRRDAGGAGRGRSTGLRLRADRRFPAADGAGVRARGGGFDAGRADRHACPGRRAARRGPQPRAGRKLEPSSTWPGLQRAGPGLPGGAAADAADAALGPGRAVPGRARQPGGAAGHAPRAAAVPGPQPGHPLDRRARHVLARARPAGRADVAGTGRAARGGRRGRHRGPGGLLRPDREHQLGRDLGHDQARCRLRQRGRPGADDRRQHARGGRHGQHLRVRQHGRSPGRGAQRPDRPALRDRLRRAGPAGPGRSRRR